MPEHHIRGHSHVPWRPSKLRVLCWRIFKRAKYRQYMRPILMGVVTNPMLNYNQGPSEWKHGHTVVYPNGPATIVPTQEDNDA